jgi:hypothetical protein
LDSTGTGFGIGCPTTVGTGTGVTLDISFSFFAGSLGVMMSVPSLAELILLTLGALQ